MPRTYRRLISSSEGFSMVEFLSSPGDSNVCFDELCFSILSKFTEANVFKRSSYYVWLYAILIPKIGDTLPSPFIFSFNWGL